MPAPRYPPPRCPTAKCSSRSCSRRCPPFGGTVTRAALMRHVLVMAGFTAAQLALPGPPSRAPPVPADGRLPAQLGAVGTQPSGHGHAHRPGRLADHGGCRSADARRFPDSPPAGLLLWGPVAPPSRAARGARRAGAALGVWRDRAGAWLSEEPRGPTPRTRTTRGAAARPTSRQRCRRRPRCRARLAGRPALPARDPDGSRAARGRTAADRVRDHAGRAR